MATPRLAPTRPEVPSKRDAGSRVPADIAGLQQELSKRIAGEVRFDSASKALYATDASNYRQVPIGVVIPKTLEDVVQTIAVCREYDAPILSRGGGTSLAGQCCNTAIVIDWSKYLNRILELNVQQKYARVEPGNLHRARDCYMDSTAFLDFFVAFSASALFASFAAFFASLSSAFFSCRLYRAKCIAFGLSLTFTVIGAASRLTKAV
jgi:hypothetical protein